jgi:hypothetical protein
MEKKKKIRAKPKYRSPESRARQLAGLSGVKIENHVMGCEHIEKINGKGLFASVPEDKRKEIFDMYCAGMSCRAIEEKTGYSRQLVDEIKLYYLDHDSQFRETMFKQNIREKLQKVADLTADRVLELAPELQGRDAVLAMGTAVDKLIEMDRGKTSEVAHQHLHLHAPADISSAFMEAMKAKKVIENE